jgi:hypothetical protein
MDHASDGCSPDHPWGEMVVERCVAPRRTIGDDDTQTRRMRMSLLSSSWSGQVIFFDETIDDFRILPAKLTSRFLLPISSRQTSR